MPEFEHEVGNEYSYELPPEPPEKSVVLDCDGDAWQRSRTSTDSAWRMVGEGNNAKYWSELLESHSPVTLVHVGQ